MAEPLKIEFQADTSRAISAMQSLAASIAGNMASAGVAMTGLATNSNNAGSALGALQQNVRRAATAVSSDVKNIASATATAATAEKATLEGVVRAFTASAASSQTAQASVRAGLTGTTAVASGLVSQIPSLKLFAAGLVGVVTSYALLSSVIQQGNDQLDRFIKLGEDAGKSSVGIEFYQRFSEAAKKAKINTDEIAAALRKAGDAVSPKFGQEDQVKKRLNEVFETGFTGDFQSKGLADYNKADSNEGRIRAAVTAMKELRDLGLQVAAIDLAEKLFTPETVNQIRTGRLEIESIVRELDRKRADLISVEEVQRADEFKERLAAAYKSINDFFFVSVALEGTGREVLNLWLGIAEGVAKATEKASGFYSEVQKAQGPLADYLKNVGLIIGGTAQIFAGNLNDKIDGTRTLYDKPIGPEQPAPSPNAIKNPPVPPRRDISLFVDEPGKGGGDGRGAGRGASKPSETLNQIETYINGLERTTAALKAETEALGKNASERLTGINLAKAEETAKQQGIKLSDAQVARIKATSAATVEYRDKIEEVREQHENLRSVGQSVLSGLVSDARSGASAMQVLTNAVGRLFDRLADQSVNGLVDVLFGKSGSTSGGILSGVFGGGKGIDVGMGLPWLKFADGGRIQGPGNGTSDDIIARLSNGEFVVNAKATKDHGPLLEAINSGLLPAFAMGGFVEPPSVAPSYSIPERGREGSWGERLS